MPLVLLIMDIYVSLGFDCSVSRVICSEYCNPAFMSVLVLRKRRVAEEELVLLAEDRAESHCQH